MTYDQTLEYLYSHLPMYQRIGSAAYKKDLTNTIELCKLLGDPQNKFACVHVGGTNGKGSVSNMLASVLMESGYKTGLYTSPHLLDFRERIRVNGNMCEKEFVVEFVNKMQSHIERIQPSFFELTVAMAFDYFAQQQIEIAVIEVGLGGRLDSTNIITPLLSVITNISYDHQQMLGNTLAEIAFEKAGIIKRGVPIVIGEKHTETMPVFEKKAIECEAPIYPAEENVTVDIVEHTVDKLELNVSYLNLLLYPDLVIGLTGNYQVANVKTLIQSVELLREIGVEISEDAVYDGLLRVSSNTGFAGRFQVISKNPLTICDCAHNSDGLNKLFGQVNQLTFDRLLIVTGMVNDKDITASLKELPQNASYFFCKPAIPRGLDAGILMEQAAQFGLTGLRYDSVKHAILAAQASAKKDDMILICGSIFVAAEALEFFNQTAEQKGNHE